MELAILRKKGFSIRDIASAMGRSPSSVSRELKRNEVAGRYDPEKADHKAYVRRKYSKYQAMKIRERPALEAYIQERLIAGWTPEEISGRLEEERIEGYGVSFKTIYRYLDTLPGVWYRQYLPLRSFFKKKRRKRGKKILIPNRIFIEERPIEACERSCAGHFEGDLLGVPRTSSETLAAVVDRRSRYVMAEKTRRREAVASYGRLLAGSFAATLTLDNDVAHVSYEELGIATYFCHPYRSWEKPTIENVFQRLRRWIPKQANVHEYSAEMIRAIIDGMNHTPRKCLGWKMPAEVFKGLRIQTFARECCT